MLVRLGQETKNMLTMLNIIKQKGEMKAFNTKIHCAYHVPYYTTK